MKSGVVAVVGRTNAGKSTLLNAILKQKVSITSPKPKTTRFSIQAVYEDNRGQIVFVDTPGNITTIEKADVVLYIIDHTRERGKEENNMLGVVRKVKVPKILVINKIDIKNPTYIVQYKFLEDEFDKIVEISALNHKNLNVLLKAIFDALPEGEKKIDTSTLVQPALNMDSRTFLSEIIREKAFLFLRREVPYSLSVTVEEVTERTNGTVFIKAIIKTSADRYKAMIIGRNGKMIKEISQASRKELETATGKKIFLELTVETDSHWADYME